MTKRKAISKSVRFEVFKRDKFTCQYCGAKAPQAVMHIDHVKPVADGGDNDIMNLLTACQDCNGGKGARPLTDTSAIDRQRKQIEELEERRQQLEMMLEWREELANHTGSVIEKVSDYLREVSGYGASEHGKATIKKWIKSFPLDTILSAIDDVFDKYAVRRDGKVTDQSWGIAFDKVPAFCRSKMKYGDGPEVGQLVYAQGIIRKRIGDKYFKCLDELKKLLDAGYSIEMIQESAKVIEDEDDFHAWVHIWLNPQVLPE